MDQKLQHKIKSDTQWPFKKREVQYQSVENLPGARNMIHRYEIMQFPASFENNTVLDIGCNLGIICIEAKKRGATRTVGFDFREETINVAKNYAQDQELSIQYHQFNVNDGLERLKDTIGADKFDYVCSLSMQKHVRSSILWDIINYYCQETCWFEGHANQNKNKVESMLRTNLNFSNIEFLGNTTDRGIRANFKIYGNL